MISAPESVFEIEIVFPIVLTNSSFRCIYIPTQNIQIVYRDCQLKSPSFNLFNSIMFMHTY